MNNDLPTSGSTRRSFIKKSVVAAVAASSMSIFSGLVNAADVNGVYHHEETCNAASMYEQATYLDPELVNGHNQCWTHVKCNGVDYYTGHVQCPDAAQDYPSWYGCVQRPARSVPEDWPLCQMALGIQ